MGKQRQISADEHLVSFISLQLSVLVTKCESGALTGDDIHIQNGIMNISTQKNHGVVAYALCVSIVGTSCPECPF